MEHIQTDKFQPSLSLLSPLNLSILVVIITLLYFRLRDTSPIQLDAQKPLVFRTFTPRTLLHFNGKPSKPWNPDGAVYLAVKGKVYDVTAGRNFYGPGGPYENFAGRDATRGLACQSFDEEMLTKDLDGPLDDCKDLSQDELNNLQGWVERFEEKVRFKFFLFTLVLHKGVVSPCVLFIAWYYCPRIFPSGYLSVLCDTSANSLRTIEMSFKRRGQRHIMVLLSQRNKQQFRSKAPITTPSTRLIIKACLKTDAIYSNPPISKREAKSHVHTYTNLSSQI